MASMDTVNAPSGGVQAEAVTAADLVPKMNDSVATALELLGAFDDAKMAHAGGRLGDHGDATCGGRADDHVESLV